MNDPSFEDTYEKLEKTVHALESGGTTLDEATRLFEEGIRLAQVCHQYLNSAELKITELQRSFTEHINIQSESTSQESDF